MSNPSWEAQIKILALLEQNQGIADLVGQNIHNSVPKEPKYPCLILQTLSEADNSADCVNLYQEFFTINVWSDYDGQKEVKDLAVKVKRLLKDRSFMLDDGQSIDIELTHVSYPKMGDYMMSEALIEFNFYYEDLED